MQYVVDCVVSSLTMSISDSDRVRAYVTGTGRMCGPGYFVWSFMDVFEYIFAYRFQFGLIGVD